MKQGILQASFACVLWGMVPAYWKLLAHVPALEVLAHRTLWSIILLLLLLAVRRNIGVLYQMFGSWKNASFYLVSSVILISNWLLFIWGVINDRVIECSLGYFLMPLFSAALGVLVFREKLSLGVLMAFALAGIGAVWMMTIAGTFPWVGFALALLFALYGLMRKKDPRPVSQGLLGESLPALIPVLIYLFLLGERREIHVLEIDMLFAFGAGLVTITPLFFYAGAAQKLPLNVLGIIQYINPSLQFLLGWLWYQEEMNLQRLIGFMWIWIALALFSWCMYHKKSDVAKIATSDESVTA